MNRCARNAGVAASLAAALAVALGAFGAHALRQHIDVDALTIWRTAVDYQMWHALALLAVAVLASGHKPVRGAGLAAAAFALGIVLFSGSLYALALGAPRAIGVITPFGGVAFLIGWITLLSGFLRNGRSVADD